MSSYENKQEEYIEQTLKKLKIQSPKLRKTKIDMSNSINGSYIIQDNI